MSLIFFGSSSFSIPVLDKLLISKIPVSAIVSTPDKPAGRGLKFTPNPVKIFAQKHHIPIFDNTKEFLQEDHSNCVGLVAAYGKIIGPKTLSNFSNHIFGIHPSLLPKYRGPSPLQYQILDGVSETGVTLYQIDLGQDSGPIMAQEKDILLPTDTTKALGDRLFTKGTELFLKTDLNSLGTPQNKTQATDTKLLTRQDGFLPWEEFIKFNYENKFRAFYPWPGIWTLTPKSHRLKLISLKPLLVQLAGSQAPQPWAAVSANI